MRSVEILAITTEVNIPQPELLEFSSSATIAGQRAVAAVRIHSRIRTSLCVATGVPPGQIYSYSTGGGRREQGIELRSRGIRRRAVPAMTRRLLVEEFIDQTNRFPDKDALVLETSQRYTYRELASLAIHIGSCVLAHTNTSDSGEDTALVCLMMHRHAGLIASMLGVIMAGAAYVPVDPAFPTDRQTYIFEHSRCQLLIIDEDCHRHVLSLGITIPPAIVVSPEGRVVSSPRPYVLDNMGERLDQARLSCHSRPMGGLMYVLYTSGSTGKPKGVMVQQYGVTNVVSWFANEIGINENYRVLGLTTACFDISVLEIYMPLVKGGTLVLADSASQRDPFRLLELLKRESVGVFQATPTTYEMMFATGWTGDRSIDFLVGGEAFRPSLVNLVRESRSVRNVYGPTETSIWSSSFTLTGSYLEMLPPRTVPVVPVGKPIGETSFYLVDAEAAETGVFREVNGSAGVEGELWIGGIGVARGYLHRPDLTQSRFLINPFGEGSVYRTGDLMRRLDSGDYMFVRRLDDQVKVDGFRIELAEIENAYSQHPLVEQAVVIVRLGKLSAYLKIRNDHELSSKDLLEIRDFISLSLTYYMVPTYTTIVKSFPKTANGKLDRNALPDPILPVMPSTPDHPDADIPFDRTMEAHVRRIIQDQRGIVVKPNSTFAAIGMDSLGAVLLVRALTETFGGVRIKPEKIFRSGVTIRSFSDELYAQLLEEHPDVVKSLRIEPNSDIEASDDKLIASEDSDEIYETMFSEQLASNIRLIQGIRGAYTALVLWDHYHGVTLMNPHIFLSDVSLFVILTGITTSFQLREPLKRISGDQMGRSSIHPYAPFDWQRFLITRFVGIYPVLWLSLLVYAPQWYLQNNVPDPPPPPRSAVAECAVLYVFGMSTWDRGTCNHSGPNIGIYYGSLILNVLIIYAVMRTTFVYLKNIVINSYNNILRNRSGDSGWSMKIFVDALICEPDRGIAPFLYLVSICFFVVLLVIALKITSAGRLDGASHIWYMLCGVIIAWIFECLYKTVFYPIKVMKPGKRSPIEALANIRSKFFLGAGKFLLLPLIEFDSDWSSLIGKSESAFESSILWRFLPDVLFIINGIILSGFGRLRNNAVASIFRWIVMQMTSSTFIVVSLLQRGESRINFSRFLLETPFMNVVGKSSFFVYLLQTAAFNFYARVIVDDAHTHSFPLPKDNAVYVKDMWSFQWYRALPLGPKIAGFLCLIAISWFLQTYYQDFFISSLANRLMAYTKKHRGKEDNGKADPLKEVKGSN